MVLERERREIKGNLKNLDYLVDYDVVVVVVVIFGLICFVL